MNKKERDAQGYSPLTLEALHGIIDGAQIAANEQGLPEVHEFEVTIGKQGDITEQYHVIKSVYLDLDNREFRILW